MKFQEIRSATAIVTFGGVRFLVDPWLGAKESIPPIPGSPNPDLRCPVSDLPLPLDEILDVDAVIATHLHFDHFDETAMERIPKSMVVFVQDEIDEETLRAKGFQDVRILKYAGVEFQGVQLTKTDCLHGQPGNIGLLYEKMNLRSSACGVVMRHPAEEKTLYLVGDTTRRRYDLVRLCESRARLVQTRCDRGERGGGNHPRLRTDHHGSGRRPGGARSRSACRRHRQPHGQCRS